MNPVCKQCGSGLPVVAEIEGRVLVCQYCVDDQDVRDTARKEYR